MLETKALKVQKEIKEILVRVELLETQALKVVKVLKVIKEIPGQLGIKVL